MIVNGSVIVHDIEAAAYHRVDGIAVHPTTSLLTERALI